MMTTECPLLAVSLALLTGLLTGGGCRSDERPSPRAEASPQLDALVEALRSDKWGDRYAAAESLAALGRRAVPALLSLFHGENDRVRQAAVWAIGRMKQGEAEQAEDALAVLVLNDRVFQVRQFAVSALARIHPRDSGSLESLIAALSDSHPAVRAAAARGFAEYFAAESEADTSSFAWLSDLIGTLRESLSDTDPLVRTSSAWALGEIGAQAAEATSDLARLQKDDHPEARYRSAIALAKLGAKAVDAEILREASGSTVEAIREEATKALQALRNRHGEE